MASGAQDLGQLPTKKKGIAAKWESFAEFLWNPETKEFLGRGLKSWGEIGLFFFVYYVLLAGFFGACLAIFFTTIDMNHPKHMGKENILRDMPGMGFRPVPYHEETLIHFEQGKRSSYQIYVDHLQAFLEPYSNQTGNVPCGPDGAGNGTDKACKFNLDMLGDQCTYENNFGYHEGKPCVLLKLNRIYGWKPEAMTPDSPGYDDLNATGQAGRMTDSSLMMTCDGQNPADNENLGDVTFFPSSGIPVKFYPYLNQMGYKQPVVMAQFTSLPQGILVQARCRIWGNNIYFHRVDRMGSVRFEILMD